MTVQYLVGDTREVIKGVADGSVDLIATSPPFLALRSYVPADHVSKGDEIGSERNPAEFIDMLLGLTAEWGRVLAAHGSIAIELGDTYSGSTGSMYDARPERVNTSYATRGHLTTDNHRNGTGWPLAKSLALIPQLYAVALAYGINPLTGQPSPAGRWLVRNVIVWHRPNPAVGALGDKVRPSTSYIVIATRSPKRWFDLTAVRGEPVHGYDWAPGSTKGHALEQFPRGGGDASRDVHSHSTNPAGAPPLDAWFDEYDGTHDTWTLTTQPSSLAHYAMWPAKLAERLVLMMCPREVCRACGEPRRRVENVEGLRGVDFKNKTQGGNGDRGTGLNGIAPLPITPITRETLGWTDCGCRCETCNGHSSCDWSVGLSDCPDCTDGRAWRPGVVLDPFAGSGTTLAVADLHGRDAIGIDFDQRNHDLYPARYDEVKRSLYGTPLPDRNQMELAL